MKNRRIVTKASKNGEFQVGDHIILHPDGSILCREAEGWMPAEDVKAATEGMESVVDDEWYAREVDRLKAAIKAIEDDIDE